VGRTRGLYYRLSEATGGKSFSELRRELMKNFTAAAKKLLAEAGITKYPGEAWFEALKIVAGPFWSIVKTQYRIPSPTEVVEAAKREVPNWRERLTAKYTAKVAATA